MSNVMPPVVKTLTVNAGIDQTFKVFTEGIAGWWPMDFHSIGEDKVETVVMEPHAGSRIYERWTDGTQHDWGRVEARESYDGGWVRVLGEFGRHIG